MTIRFIVASIILTGIISYAGYESRKLVWGPSIDIETPSTGAVSNSPVTHIKGRVENIVRVSMNDRDIPVDEQGHFAENYVLSNGNNIVKVAAEDRFGRKTEKYIQVLYDAAQPLVQNTLPAQN